MAILDELELSETVNTVSWRESPDWAMGGGAVIGSFGNLRLFTEVKVRVAKSVR